METERDIELIRNQVKMTFAIDGITCSNCTNGIEKAVRTEFSRKGLQSVTCLLLTQKLVVEFSSEEVSANDVVDEVEAIGFGCELLTTETIALNQDLESG